MTYHSAHTGPEVDAAVSLLHDVQDIRDETVNSTALAEQAAIDAKAEADRAQNAVDSFDGDITAAVQARDEALGYRDDAALHAQAADSARAAAVVARNGAQNAQSAAAISEVNAKDSETTSATYANNAAGSESAAFISAVSAQDDAEQTALDRIATGQDRIAAASSASAASTSATGAATSATNASTSESGAVSARNTAEQHRDAAKGYRDEAQQAATDANDVVLGNVFDDTAMRSDRGWTSQKIDSEIDSKATTLMLDRFGGASTTSGVLDWNEHTVPGIAPVLLLGSAANGPGTGQYYHLWNLEYGTGNQGNGNITQVAIPYGNQGSVNGGVFWFRGRYSGDWTDWERTFTTVTPPTIAQIPQLQVALDAKVSAQAGYSVPANAKQTQWDQAYGWGNHASAGYATSAALTSGLAGKVGTSDARLTDSREWSASTVTQATAEAGTSTARFAWTAQRVRQAITAWWGTVTQAAIRTKVGTGTMAYRDVTISTGAPSGGANGDIHIQV